MRDKPAEFEHYSAPPPPPPVTVAIPDCRHRAAAATLNHRPTSISLGLTETAPLQPEDHSQPEPPPGPRRKPPAPLPPPRCPEVDSHELTGSQSEVLTLSDPSSALDPTHTAKGDSEQGKGQGAGHHQSASPPASSYRPSGPTSMEGHRSPSPQFSPQKLSDRPPVSFQDDDSNR